jgi:hypothetical protein
MNNGVALLPSFDEDTREAPRIFLVAKALLDGTCVGHPRALSSCSNLFRLDPSLPRAKGKQWRT